MKVYAMLVLAAGLLVAADTPQEGTIPKDFQDLQGTWQVTSVTSDGKDIPAEEIKGFKVRIQGDKYTLEVDKQVLEEGQLKVDSSQKPKTIDSIAATGANKGKSQRGIYEVEGDNLKICFAPPGKDQRPTELASKPGSLNELSVYKKEKP